MRAGRARTYGAMWGPVEDLGKQDKSRAVGNPEPIHMSDKSATLACAQPFATLQARERNGRYAST